MMSTLHKVKAYFGMAPMEDYDDDYYDDGDDRSGTRDYAPRAERFTEDAFDRVASRPEPRYEDRFEERFDGRDYDDAPVSYRGGYDDAPREPRYRSRDFERPREFERSRFGALRGSTRGALAMDPRRMATTARPAPSANGSAMAPRSSWIWCRWTTPTLSGWSTSRRAWPLRCEARSTR